VSNSQWDQHPDEPANDPLQFSNIAYTVHFYAGTHGAWLRE
jgi:aryl-phospho-beta-D-glucosidase BglC (GH1 family)